MQLFCLFRVQSSSPNVNFLPPFSPLLSLSQRKKSPGPYLTFANTSEAALFWYIQNQNDDHLVPALRSFITLKLSTFLCPAQSLSSQVKAPALWLEGAELETQKFSPVHSRCEDKQTGKRHQDTVIFGHWCNSSTA